MRGLWWPLEVMLGSLYDKNVIKQFSNLTSKKSKDFGLSGF